VYAGLIALIALLAIAAAPLMMPAWFRWCLILVGLLGCTAGIGVFRTGSPLGALITDRNVMSLSRLQTVLWTVLVLSGWAAVVFARLVSGDSDPLSVGIQPSLYALMGINAAALIGTPFVLSVRSNKPVDPQALTDAAQDAAHALGEPVEDIVNRADGVVYTNESPDDARLTDIFEGDEVGNTYVVDLAKVQMFFFTTVSALVWLIAVLHLLDGHPESATALPTLPDGMVTLMGFSNAAYVASKGIDHTNAN
jgi:hypothetical protein